MRRIIIPPKLSELLQENKDVEAFVLSAISAIEPWLADETTGLPFFPEYTDHGPKHINGVLQSTTSLISEEAWPLLTPNDGGALILATLLHDCAMHLTEDGFLALVEGDWPLISETEDIPWSQLWDDFYREARRWDGRTLLGIFGEPDPKSPDQDYFRYIQRPRQMGTPETWPKLYRRFIGEFIRRHHARLAHEVAVIGIPATSGKRFSPLSGIPAEFADLCGIIARSHNLDIRNTFPYLLIKYDGRVSCRGIHAIFIMVLLRIADFLELSADRAPKTILQIRSLKSPISRREWRAHHSVVEVRRDEQDMEAIFVVAKPSESEVFLRMKRLLSDLQFELDRSWAILGEVYSKHDDQNLDKLGITLRRVRSNLDHPEKFASAQKIDYVPAPAAFEAADADLLKLLIHPLYGDHPSVGVRELLQNAVDAVLELQEYNKLGRLENPEINREFDVLIRLKSAKDTQLPIYCRPPESWHYWIEICDHGVGMSADTIRNYFLKAGASYRRSDAWRSYFETESAGGTKQVSVLRSGRFGVGALAALLLGSEIQVFTRHFKEERGICFSARLEDENVELKYLEHAPIGTTIRVKLESLTPLWNETLYGEKGEDWDWFCLEIPKVIRRGPDGSELTQAHHLPYKLGPLPNSTRRIQPVGYDDIQWTYSDIPALVCNGIIVRGQRGFSFRVNAANFEHHGYTFQIPNLSVFDSLGSLPLNLQRTELTTEEYPFVDALHRDVVVDYLAYLQAHGPKAALVNAEETPDYFVFQYPTLRWQSYRTSGNFYPLVSTNCGFSFLDPYCLEKCGIDSLHIIGIDSSASRIPRFIHRPLKGAIGFSDSNSWQIKRSAVSLLLGDSAAQRGTPFEEIKIRGSRVLLRAQKALDLMQHRGLRKDVRANLSLDKIGTEWAILTFGECPKQLSFDIERLRENPPIGEWDDVFAEVYLHLSPASPRNGIAKMWIEAFPTGIIPFNRDLGQINVTVEKLYEYTQVWAATEKPNEPEW